MYTTITSDGYTASKLLLLLSIVQYDDIHSILFLMFYNSAETNSNFYYSNRCVQNDGMIDYSFRTYFC